MTKETKFDGAFNSDTFDLWSAITIQPDLPEKEETAETLLKRTFFIVEATSFEGHCLWEAHSSQSTRTLPNGSHVDWVQLNPGYVVQIGTLDGRPVVLSMQWATLDDKLVMFWDMCSQVCDYKMAEKWLDEHFFGMYDSGTRRASCDAKNFHMCIHAIRSS